MTTCKYDPATKRRYLSGRHNDDCDGTDCPGCQPCAQRHCVVCWRNHADDAHPQTCARCVHVLRQELATVVVLADALPGQAARAGQDGHLLASAPIPGGDATVLLADGSDGRAQVHALCTGQDAPHASDERRADPQPPLHLLASWEDDWRLTFGHGGGPRATMARVVGYLNEHLARAAQHHEAFEEFAADLRGCRIRLEDVLHAGERDETGAPCVHCGTELVRRTRPAQPCARQHQHVEACDQGGLADEWRCPRCHRVYDLRSYWNAVSAAYRAHASAMTAEDIGVQYGVSRGTVWVWANRGRVRKRGKDARGRQLYDVADVRQHAEC